MGGAVAKLTKRVEELVMPIGKHSNLVKQEKLSGVAVASVVVCDSLGILALRSNQCLDEQLKKTVGNQNEGALVVSNLRQFVEEAVELVAFILLLGRVIHASSYNRPELGNTLI